MTSIRLLTGVQVQQDGTEIMTSPEKLNFKTGPTFGVQESPSGTAEITIPTGIPAQTIQVSDVPFGVRVYDCIYATHPFAAAASAAMVANQIYAFRFRLDKARTIDEFWFRYNAGGGAKNLRVGIYSQTSDTNRYPNALLLDVSASGTSLGFVMATSLSLDPGWYWQVFLHDVTNAAMAVPSTALFHSGTGYSAVAGPTMVAGLKVAHTYGALPNPFTAGASFLTASDVFPFIGTHFSA